MKARIIFFVVALYSCYAIAAPDHNANPTEKIEVVGTLPNDVEAVLVEDWYATTDSMFCQQFAGARGFTPSHFAKPSTLLSSSDGKRVWVVWRDGVKAGICHWALKQIVVYLDSKASGANPNRESNIPIRIAYVRGTGEPRRNTWASNDDSNKPTHRRCKFTLGSQLPLGSSKNPCTFFDENVRGSEFGKYEHILLPDHKTVNFVITIADQKTTNFVTTESETDR